MVDEAHFNFHTINGRYHDFARALERDGYVVRPGKTSFSSATMRGTQTYRVRVTGRGKVLREAEFKTTKATTATYANLPDRVPSKFDRVVVRLGGGVHELAIELLSPVRGSAEIRARIPQPSVGNEE